MIIAQSVPLSIDRGAPRVYTIQINGVDLTGADFHGQLRLKPDTPGDPLLDLPKVTDATIAGVRLVSTDLSGTIPISVVRVQIPTIATGTDAGQLPPAPLIGGNATIAWDLFVTMPGTTTARWFYGPVTITGTVTKAASAPALIDDPLPGMDAFATLVGTDLTVELYGAALIAPLLAAADGSAGAAVAAAAHAESQAQVAVDAANMAQAQVNLALPKSGGVMTGSIDMGTNPITAVGAPDSDDDAANKGYVDATTADVVEANIAEIGFDPSGGYEVDLAGVTSAERDKNGALLDYFDDAGNRRVESPLILAQPVSAPSIALGGVRETNLTGYESDLAGGSRLYVDDSGKLLASDDGMGNFPVTAPIRSPFGAAFGDGVSAPSLALGGVGETNLAGYEADLAGGSRLFVDQNGKVLTSDDGGGHFPVDGPINSPYGAAFAGPLSGTQLALNGIAETNALGYEADLVGGPYFVVDANSNQLAGASSGSADLISYTTATHSDSSIATVELIGGKPQIVTFDAPSGTRTVLTTDGASNVAPAITAAKQVIYTSDATGSAKRMWKPLLGGTAWPVVASTLIVIDGDSIGENFTSGFTPTLMALLPTRVIQPEAIGGQRTDQIAKRNGALSITTAIFTGNQVPASGAVAVTGIDVLQSTSNRSIMVDVYGTDGSVVQGVLAFTASGTTYAFTRSSAGAAMPVPAGGVTLVPRSGLSQLYAIEDLKVGIHIYQAGRNDIGKVGYSEDATFGNIVAMVGNNMPIARQWLIDGVISGLIDLPTSMGGTRTDEASSLVILQQIQSLNARLSAYAGSRFVDMLAAIKTAGLTSQFTVGGIQFDIPNTDFSGTDGLHPTQAAGKTAMAGTIVTKMTQKGWL